MNRIDLKGLTLAPSQIWGSIRLVPLLREKICGDLRLWKRSYDEEAAAVRLSGRPYESGTFYGSYIPHGLVIDWRNDGTAAAAFGTHLEKRDRGDLRERGREACLLHRMVKREDSSRLRILPLHLAMEGFLSLQFGGPEIAWEEYSKQALSRGLSPRIEPVAWGLQLRSLEGALRVFEIYENQVGVLLFVGDTLASAFVVSHPDDYRALHRTLLEDFYGPTLLEAARFVDAASIDIDLDDAGIASFEDLRRALGEMRNNWAAFQIDMSAGLLGRAMTSEKVYRAGPFQLYRFMTDLRPSEENHIGEYIEREDGSIEYLKTYRLSAAQSKRAFLLTSLAKYNWNIDATACGLSQSRDELLLRFNKAGFGYLLQEHVLKKAASNKRRR